MNQKFHFLTIALLGLVMAGCQNPSLEPTKNSNTDLANLSVDNGALSPVFAAGTTAYTLSVANIVTSVIVTGTKAANTSSVSSAVTLSNLVAGVAQTATITVTAQNGSTKTYTVSVTRRPVYTVTYSANGGTGLIPVDSASYETGASVSVPGNTGNLSNSNYAFAGWNTKADGSGTSYAPGSALSMGSANLPLYALWTTILYNGNGNTGGTVPIDTIVRFSGQTVTVLDNPGNLVKTGYYLASWNTKADGTGTSYAAGGTSYVISGTSSTISGSYTQGSNYTTLYANWVPSVKAISAGSMASHILRNNETLWATGYNNYGNLGDGTIATRTTPVQISISGKTIASVTGSLNYHTMILASDGTLWGTGYNANWELGTSSGSNVGYLETPTQISTATAMVSAGSTHLMFVKIDGTLWAAGANNNGQLGDGTLIAKSSPVQITIPGKTIASVSAGSGYSMILATDGTLWATGGNSFGELGNGTTTNTATSTPIQVIIPGKTIASVSTGGSSTMIVATDGTLWATGYNNYGQLGDGTTTNKSTPVPISIPGKTIASVSTSGSHTIIVTTDGTLWATGLNFSGQLGIGTAGTGSDKLTPVQVVIPGKTVASASAGTQHTLILATDGSLWAFGSCVYGQLGNGISAFNTYRSLPIHIIF